VILFLIFNHTLQGPFEAWVFSPLGKTCEQVSSKERFGREPARAEEPPDQIAIDL
jgi:hypothetical protein